VWQQESRLRKEKARQAARLEAAKGWDAQQRAVASATAELEAARRAVASAAKAADDARRAMDRWAAGALWGLVGG
jgi:hypothetical protein